MLLEMLNNLVNIIIIVVLVSLFVVVLDGFTSSTAENMVNIKPVEGSVKWNRDPTCKYKLNDKLKETLEKYGITETKKDDWNLYVPCTYNNISKEIDTVKPASDDQRIFVVNNADELTSKNHIWKNLVKTYGRDEAKKMMPLTYILSASNDVILFESEYDHNKIYILKKNIQRQEGLKITRDIAEIRKGAKDGYVIVQELLQDPYTIDNRKINLRCYLLLVCQNNDISAYVYNDGFVYYTRMPFIKNSTQTDPNVTTGYIDRKVYEVNPLTHKDLQKYLDDYKGHPLTQSEVAMVRSGKTISKVVFNRIYELVTKIVLAVKDSVCVDSHIKNAVTFQLFGVDVALDEELHPTIMEVNKGPDMGAKDGRDSELKSAVMADIFKVIKLVPTDNGEVDYSHNFIKIYE